MAVRHASRSRSASGDVGTLAVENSTSESLVLVSVSTEMALNVASTARFTSALSRSAGTFRLVKK